MNQTNQDIPEPRPLKPVKKRRLNPVDRLVVNFEEKLEGLPETTPAAAAYVRAGYVEAEEARVEAEQVIHHTNNRVRRNRYRGRPTEYSPAVADRICRQIEQGYSVRGIVSFDPHVPSRATIHRWLREHPEFRDQYAQAQQLRADAYFDMALEIACGEPDIHRARLIVDTLKWMAGKLSPKKYGKTVLFDGEVRQFNAIALVLQQIVSKPELLAEIVSNKREFQELTKTFQLSESSDPGSSKQKHKTTNPIPNFAERCG